MWNRKTLHSLTLHVSATLMHKVAFQHPAANTHTHGFLIKMGPAEGTVWGQDDITKDVEEGHATLPQSTQLIEMLDIDSQIVRLSLVWVK